MPVRPIQPTHPNPTAVELRHAGVWQPRTLTAFLRDAAENHPGGVALVQGETRFTFAEMWRETLRLAAGIAELGLQTGEVVSYVLPNWWQAVLLHHAGTALGLVNNPIVPIYRHAEIGFIAREAQPSLIVIPHLFRGFDYVRMLAELRDEGALPNACRVVVVRPQGTLPHGFVAFDELFREPPWGPRGVDHSHAGDITLLLYTSGTTAAAKGVMHSHETLAYGIRSATRWFDLGQEDVIFMPSPVTHITGIVYGVQLAPMLAAPLVLLDVWDPAAAADLIERTRCTFTGASTPFLQGLVEAYERRGTSCHLRTFLCGGADVPPDLVRRARQQLDAVVVRGYGSTEILTLSAGSADDPVHKAAETDGRPIVDAECRVRDEEGRDVPFGQVGELAVAAPECFLGYLDPILNKDAFTDDGFFLTGDLASLDADSFVTIHGRKKDIIIRGGENISAKAIEDLLFEHPAVVEVAVVAMPDRRLGEKACAYVALAPGGHFDFDEMTRYLASRRVARQKFPERLEIVPDGLPKTASGKIQKFRLRDDARLKVAGSKSQVPGQT